MKKHSIKLAATAFTLLASSGLAQVWGPGIVIDGNVDEWDGQVPALVLDASGDGGTGRDVQAVYLANDQNNLYVRIQSYNSDGYDGSEFSGIDGDNSSLTGFSLFGGAFGSDTLIAGASVYGETTGNFNSGSAVPGSVPFGPFVASTDIEYAIALNTTIPGDILASFPGGLGSTIAFLYGDGNGGAGDTTAVTPYILASASTAVPTSMIDNGSLYDTAPNAALRTNDISGGGGFSVTRTTTLGPTGIGDSALGATHTNAAVAFGGSFISHRFASPVDITGHTSINVDLFGSTSVTDQNVWVGLLDTDGTYFAVGGAFPNTAAWTTVDVGPTSAWFLQAAGANSTLDLNNIIEWRLGLQESSGVGGTYTVGYDNLRAIGISSVTDWQLLDH